MKKHIALFMATAMVVSTLSGVSTPVQVEAAGKTVSVSTQKQLNSALKDKKVTNITIKTSAKKTFKLQKGSYTKKVLTINAPKATVSNAAKLKTIVVKDATKLTENAKGNTIKVTDSKLSVVVGKSASVNAVSVEKKNAACTITANGVLKTLNVKAKANVTLKGSTKKSTKVNVKATGAKITSDNMIFLYTTKSVNVVLNKNAKGSTITSKSSTANVKVTNKTGSAIKVKLKDGSVVVVENGKTTTIKGKNDQNNGSNGNNDNSNPSNNGSGSSGIIIGGGSGSGSGNGNGQVPPSVSSNIGAVTATTLGSIGNVAGKVGTLTVNSSEATSFEIPDGDYSGIDLVVNAPNATVTNAQKFKSIKLVSIAADTWYELARDNMFEIAVAGNQSTIHMVVSGNGAVQSMNVTRPVTLCLEGTVRVPLTLTNEAAGSHISTTAPVILTNEARNVELRLNSLLASQTSSVTVADPALIPTLSAIDASIGISVTVGENTQISMPNQIYDDTTKGKVSGCVSSNAVSGNSIAVSGNTVSIRKIEAGDPGTTVASATTDDYGMFIINEVPYGTYVFEVKDASGNLLYVAIINVASSEIVVPGIVLGGLGNTSKIDGTVKSALTGEVMPNVTVKLYRGRDITNMTQYSVGEAVSTENGSYTFSGLASGVYTVVVNKDGFSRTASTVVVAEGETINQQIVISERTITGNDHIRFVLTWNAHDDEWLVPSDLDSHLYTPDGHHTWYGYDVAWMQNANNDSENWEDRAWARLDVDDTDYEGPETTSVYNLENGVYHFYVHNFGESSDSTTLKTSGAMVQVYVDGYLRGICSVDANTDGTVGNYWDVCTYDSNTNTLTVIDKIMKREDITFPNVNYGDNYWD